MNVTTFLNLPIFKDFTVLAGEKGLDKEITGVNILDNPNATDWLSPGELIVTSGYFFKESPKAIDHFLTGFSRLNIPAICIKPQIYLTPLPEQLITLCDELAIPLIEIPYGMAFSKILNTVMNLLSETSNKSTQIALDVNSTFLEYGLQGEGLDFLQNKLTKILSNPLIITDSDWMFLTKDKNKDFSNYLKPHQQTATFDLNSLLIIPTNIDKLKHPVTITFKDGENGLILPIFFTEITYGYIIVLQKNSAISQRDYIVIEQAAITFALEIVHQTEKARINNRILRDFYRKLLFGDYTLDEMRSYAIEFNYDIPYSVFIISADMKNKNSHSLLQQEHTEDTLFRKLLDQATKYQHALFKDVHLFKQGNYIIGLLGHPESLPNHYEEQQQTFFTDFYHYLKHFFDTELWLKLFVGPVETLSLLHQSYNEAKQMIQYDISHQKEIYFASDFYFDNFIHRFINEKEAYEFINHYLEPIITYDDTTDSYLLNTLTVYLENHQNLAVTSRELFIHRNTLLYRIEKIEKLLGYSLTLAESAFGLAFAIKLYKSYPKNEKNLIDDSF